MLATLSFKGGVRSGSAPGTAKGARLCNGGGTRYPGSGFEMCGRVRAVPPPFYACAEPVVRKAPAQHAGAGGSPSTVPFRVTGFDWPERGGTPAASLAPKLVRNADVLTFRARISLAAGSTSPQRALGIRTRRAVCWCSVRIAYGKRTDIRSSIYSQEQVVVEIREGDCFEA